MPETLRKMKDSLAGKWGRLERTQKVRLYAIAAVVVASLAICAYIYGRVSYEPLLTVGNAEERGEIVRILQDSGIRFKSDGNAILVDDGKKNAAEAALVRNGYPKSPDTIFADAFSRIQLSNTEADKRKLFIDSQQRTIAQKLKLLEYIDDATVNLTIPERPILLFNNEEVEEARAAVMVRQNRQLSLSQVNAIINWVCMSVEGLKPSNVSLIDYEANDLVPSSDNELRNVTDQQQYIRKLFKGELEANVRRLFTSAVEYGNFEYITCAAQPYINYNDSSVESRRYQFPDGGDEGVIISQRIERESATGYSYADEPGLMVNPGYDNTQYDFEYDRGSSSFDRYLEETNYGYDEVVTSMTNSADIDMSRTTMAVNVLYGDRVRVDDETINAEAEKIRDSVSMATGIPIENVTVHPYRMASKDEAEADFMDGVWGFLNRYGALLVILLLTILLMLILLPRRRGETSVTDLTPLPEAGPL
ncbi:MAG: hypothetical protein FWE70_00205, partial [Oscillospiraceae bacterium]|nr:hypothetical protein [Oscillospiraceae bacterium]